MRVRRSDRYGAIEGLRREPMKAGSLDKPVDDNFFNREMKGLVAVSEGVKSGSSPENQSITEVAGLPRMLQERLNQLTVFCQIKGAKKAHELAVFAGMLFVETPNSVH
jgi:hypothetical protein